MAPVTSASATGWTRTLPPRTSGTTLFPARWTRVRAEGVPAPSTIGTRNTTVPNPARRMDDSATALVRRYSLDENSSAPGALK